jgi:Uma2 family endonuclease
MAMYRSETHEPRPRRLTVEDYYRMAEVGILGPDDRVELIDGEIIDVPPPGELHAGTVAQLNRLLERVVGNSAIVWSQNPAVLGRYSVPQPDVALLRSRADFYKSGLPRAGDVLLLVEVSDSSLHFDRDVKAALYAEHAIPEFWLVDVRSKRITRYRDPRGRGYMRVDEPDLGAPVEIPGLADTSVALAALFAD